MVFSGIKAAAQNISFPSLALYLLTVLILAGCSAGYYRQSADRDVYEILHRQHRLLYESEELYRIEQLAADPFTGLTRAAQPILEAPPGVETPAVPPRIISLEKALEIAEFNSRDYQSQKEEVYLSALALTSERYRFSSQFDSLISALWTKTPFDESVSATGSLSVSRLLKTGAAIGINLTSEFLRFLTGDPRGTSSSLLAVSIIQPLWRGAGERVVAEDLKQAERDLIYQIRSFARFKKTYAVFIASAYYRLLQQRAVVRNEQRNHQTLVAAGERAGMLAAAGRVPEFQVDQAKQDELRARDRWTRAITGYFDLLDRFKIALGLPTEADVDVDESDLEALVDVGIGQPELSAKKAIEEALVRREDLKVAEGRVADAGRSILVAEDGLAPSIDLVFSSRIPSESDNRPLNFRLNEATWNAGLNADLPFDRLLERNSYRIALINFDRAERNYQLLTDTVVLEVRDAWRSLEQARASYDIQENSVELARRRVDSTTLLLQAGRASTRDLLESQAALVEAENGFVQALTDHTIARLEFYRDTGLLDVSQQGFLRVSPEIK